MKQSLLKIFLLSTSLLPLCGLAQAQERKTDEFELGTITIVGHRKQVGEVGLGQTGEKISADDMARYNRKDIGDALDLATGVTLSTNSRNEKLVYIRGFDTRQVPLFIDGIPVYVPYDGYVDFGC
jgi:iron complex outermembrane receptor protein